MAIDKELLRFDEYDVTELGEAVAMVASIVGKGEKAGWVNLEPVVDDDELERLRRTSPPAIVRVFSAKGGQIPFATYVPGLTGGPKAAPASVGLQHGAGGRAVAQLREAGIEVPAGWRVRQDHPKRGLVFDVPADEGAASVVRFLVLAARALSGVRFASEWTAVLCRPR